MIAKSTCALLTVTFAAAAVVQLNDPDPVVWFCLYGLVAAILAMAMLGRFSNALTWGAGLVCAAGSLYLLPSVVELWTRHDVSMLLGPMSPDQPFIEESRESLGLLLAVAALVYVHWLARRASREVGA